MPRDQEGAGAGGGKVSSDEGWVEGNGPESLTEAIRQAVDDANQEEGTLLRVDIYVRSVGDPDVGAYKAKATAL